MKFTRPRVDKPTMNEHDQTKDMLRFMTEGVQKPETENALNEHDQTKTMLKVLNEDMGQQETMSNVSIPQGGAGKDDVITLSGSELLAEENLFGEHVTQDFKTDLNPEQPHEPMFKIYPEDNNVVWSGIMGKGINWTLSKNDDAVIKAENLELEDRDMEMVQDLKKYASNWADEWAKKLRTDYKPKRNEFG